MPLTATRPHVDYTREGAAGPAVLLIMGFGMSGRVWRPQVDDLARTHQVAFYDHLGIGESEPPTHGATMASMAGDAGRVLDALDWADAHVVGVSMGGMIAQELALRAPSRVRSLTLIATHAGGLVAAMPRAEGLFHFAAANLGQTHHRVAALKRLLYTPEFLATVDGARLDARIAEMAGKRAPGRTLTGHLRAVLRHRTYRRLGRISAPTLVVRPGRDLLVHPRNSDVLARVIPGARLVRFDDAGHGVTFQRAADLNAELARHFAEVDAQLGKRHV